MNAVRLVYIVAFLVICSVALFISDLEIRAALVLIPIMGFADVLAYVCMIETPNIRNRWWTIIYIIDLLLVVTLMLFTKANLLWAVLTLSFADVLKIFVYSILMGKRFNLNKKSFRLIKEMLLFGFFPMLALLMTTLNYRIDVIMLRMFSNISKAQIGVYSIGINVAERIVLIPDTLKGILASKLSKGANEEEVSKVSRLCFLASAVMCALVLAVGYWGISILYGSEYEGAYPILVISAGGAIFIGFFKLIAQYNIINGKQIYNVIILSVSIVFNIVGNLVFIPIWDTEGAAIATGIGHFVCGIIFVSWFCKKTNTPLKDMFIVRKNELRSALQSLKGKKDAKTE